jgi:hypothetical protein
MKTLIVISRAHAETAFRIAHDLNKMGNNIAIVFTGRGLHHISNPNIISVLYFAELFTLKTEFDSTLDIVQAISYDYFVGLLEESERIFSWI